MFDLEELVIQVAISSFKSSVIDGRGVVRSRACVVVGRDSRSLCLDRPQTIDQIVQEEKQRKTVVNQIRDNRRRWCKSRAQAEQMAPVRSWGQGMMHDAFPSW